MNWRQTWAAAKEAFWVCRHWAGILIGLVGVYLTNQHVQPWVLDDAYITFCYAENFAAGKGLVWNAGEYVEGITSLLWTLMLGAANYLGCDTTHASRVLGILFAMGTVMLLGHAHLFLRGLPRNVSAMAAALAGLWPPFGAWAQSGMEVPVAAFWCVLAFLLYFRWRMGAKSVLLPVATAVVCGLAFLTRPEAGLLFGAIALELAWRERLAVFRRGFVFGFVFAAFVVGVTVWRWYYYHDYVPNTFHAKVGASQAQLWRGLSYLHYFSMASPAILVPLLAGLVLLGRDTTWNWARGGLGLFLVLHTLYVIGVGGDVMPAYRFFASVIPVAVLFIALSLEALAGHWSRAWLAVALVGAHAVYTVREDPALNFDDPVSRIGRLVGIFMKEHYPPGTLLATNSAGAIPYFSELPTIDMLGLCDRTIAYTKMPRMGSAPAGHEKANGKYVLSRQPAVIQFGSSFGQKDPRFFSDQEVARSPEFKKWYDLKVHEVKIGDEPPFRLTVFERRTEPKTEAELAEEQAAAQRAAESAAAKAKPAPKRAPAPKPAATPKVMHPGAPTQP